MSREELGQERPGPATVRREQDGPRGAGADRPGLAVRPLRRREHGGQELPVTRTRQANSHSAKRWCRRACSRAEQLSTALAEQKATGRHARRDARRAGRHQRRHARAGAGRDAGRQGLPAPPRADRPGPASSSSAPKKPSGCWRCPMFKVHGTLTVAMTEPQSLPKIDRLRQLTGCKIRTGAGAGGEHPRVHQEVRRRRDQRRRLPHVARRSRTSRSSSARASTRARPPTWTRWSPAARSSTWSTSRC